MVQELREHVAAKLDTIELEAEERDKQASSVNKVLATIGNVFAQLA